MFVVTVSLLCVCNAAVLNLITINPVVASLLGRIQYAN
ncbi:hypothetical protein MWLp12_3121 [Lactiplantibacillus plantarum]|nr:hypothetical protein MWLp12_3121 [Lactiplantibacillus plantarum]